LDAQVIEEPLVDGDNLTLGIQNKNIAIDGLFDGLNEGILGDGSALLLKNPRVRPSRRCEVC
jgi:hypothetical protein